MGKFGCTCGNIISDVIAPNDVTGFVLSDKSSEIFCESISDVIGDFFNHFNADTIEEWRAKHFNEMYPTSEPLGEMIHDVLFSRLMDVTLGMFECDECGRLWVQESPTVNKYKAYSPDDPLGERAKILGLNQDAGSMPDSE
ncbi:MAG: hypothetical protein HON04_20420 [Planctomicrobium sp.]|jgi:hypothetical protein|nr:hypothetical protein [Planctomicrobium sp.]